MFTFKSIWKSITDAVSEAASTNLDGNYVAFRSLVNCPECNLAMAVIAAGPDATVICAECGAKFNAGQHAVPSDAATEAGDAFADEPVIEQPEPAPADPNRLRMSVDGGELLHCTECHREIELRRHAIRKLKCPHCHHEGVKTFSTLQAVQAEREAIAQFLDALIQGNVGMTDAEVTARIRAGV